MGLHFLLVPFVLMGLAIVVAFLVSLTMWLSGHNLKLRGFRIVYSKRSVAHRPRGFEVKLPTGGELVMKQKEDDHG
jgi:hypothetical protein